MRDFGKLLKPHNNALIKLAYNCLSFLLYCIIKIIIFTRNKYIILIIKYVYIVYIILYARWIEEVL